LQREGRASDGVRPQQFSEASGTVILHGKVSSQLTFENFLAATGPGTRLQQFSTISSK